MYLTLLAVFIWSVGNIVDKYVLHKYVRRPEISVVFTSIVGVFVAIGVSLFITIAIPPLPILLLLFLSGILWVVSTMLYFKAVFIGEISRIAALFAFGPIFVLVLSTIFLGEFFQLLQYAGIGMIIVGSVLLSLKGTSAISLKALVLMIFAGLFYASQAVMLKYTLGYISVWDAFFWLMIGSVLTVPFLLAGFWNALKDLLLNRPRGALYMIGNEALNALATFMIIIALSTGFATLVSTLGQTEPLFVLGMAILLSMKKPHILKEELQKSVLSLKIIAIVLTVIGAILLV